MAAIHYVVGHLLSPSRSTRFISTCSLFITGIMCNPLGSCLTLLAGEHLGRAHLTGEIDHRIAI